MVHPNSVRPTVDQDAAKGATEDGPQDRANDRHDNTSMQGQLGHRDQNSQLKDADSDYPEPGLNAEHTGEPEER